MDSKFFEIWQAVCEGIKRNCSEANFKLWFSPLVLTDMTDTITFFTYPSTAKRNIFFIYHLKVLKENLDEVLGFPTEVVILSLEELNAESREEQVQFCIDLCKNKKVSTEELNNASSTFITNLLSENNLLEPDELVEPNYYDSLNSSEQIFDSKNPPKKYQMEYTFDNFVVGNSNRFAAAACVACADNPGRSYNPLFIYGPSGLGKTHLLYAISNQILKNNPKAIIIYVKSEEFLNQLVDSVSNHTTAAFRQKYRHCDAILVDDVQFFAGKNSVQEEFFHTFNSLFENKKQIILTSDRPPKELKSLEERIRTRFEWGLMADIQPPDLELRMAILKRKAQDLNIQVSNEVLNFLAENIKNNIRQIEGAIKRLDAYSKLNGKSISIDLAKSVVGDILNIEDLAITKEKIISEVSAFYNVNSEEIRGKKRTGNIVNARFVAIYLLRTLTEMSSPEIGKEFQRDHTTVLNAETKISDRLKNDPQLEYEINLLIKKIKN